MNNFNIYEADLNSIYFIGIGGVSMSGLATIMLDKGVNVAGSDRSDSKILRNLRNKGADIYIGHSSDNIKNPDLVIYTDAINDENPEFLECKKRNIPCIDRGTFLGQLMKIYDNSIAVAGTHGKTTTTSILSVLLNESDFDPTILLGGNLAQIEGNVRIGSKKLLITEACEYKANILKFHPTIGLVLNIDNDHLDFYNSIDDIVDTFKEFVDNIPEDGYLVVNNDDEHSMKIVDNAKCNIRTFGKSEDSYYRITDLKVNNDFTSSYVLIIDGKERYNVDLNVIGEHNIINSAAAISASHCCGADIDYLLKRIKDYIGTSRRLEKKGSCNGFAVIDDYAHHPTEVKATLKAIKYLNSNKVWCIFQPHTYSRSHALMNDFSESFYDADTVIITDIYAAREENWGNVHSENFVEKLTENGVESIYIKDFKDIEKYIKENAKENDIVLTMGAGDVYEVGESIIENCN
ncbi:MAG: UDP-N-acetylmuramate--L-alanine ligase [Andreesenia angusta]|nr:UDP-N-acetylmuramate--L-alanine ligase [Andreesenia angusta]